MRNNPCKRDPLEWVIEVFMPFMAVATFTVVAFKSFRDGIEWLGGIEVAFAVVWAKRIPSSDFKAPPLLRRNLDA